MIIKENSTSKYNPVQLSYKKQCYRKICKNKYNK